MGGPGHTPLTSGDMPFTLSMGVAKADAGGAAEAGGKEPGTVSVGAFNTAASSLLAATTGGRGSSSLPGFIVCLTPFLGPCLAGAAGVAVVLVVLPVVVVAVVVAGVDPVVVETGAGHGLPEDAMVAEGGVGVPVMP